MTGLPQNEKLATDVAIKKPGSAEVIPFNAAPPITWNAPDLSLLSAPQLKAPSFPEAVLGSFWSDWCRTTAASKNAPFDYVGASLITLAAALIGNARTVTVGGWSEPSIFWTVLIGNPSSGKSPALDPFSEIIQALEAELADDGAEGADGNSEPVIHIDDVTAQAAAEVAAFNPKGLILFRDELSGWWGRLNQYGGDTFWLKAFGARPERVTRKKALPIHIPRLSISVLGGSQPDTLRTFVTAKQNKGFAARWLYIFPEPSVGFRIAKAAKMGVALDRLRSLRKLGLSGKKPVGVPLARKAKARFEAWVADKQIAAKSDEEGVWGQWLGKQGGVALRLALVFEHLWWAASARRTDQDGPKQVSAAALTAAMKFIDDYATPMAAIALNNAGRPVEEQDARSLLRLVERGGARQFNARQVSRGAFGPAGRLSQPSAMLAACEVLEASMLIRHIGVRAGDRKGRRPSDFEINPVLVR